MRENSSKGISQIYKLQQYKAKPRIFEWVFDLVLFLKSFLFETHSELKIYYSRR